MREEDFFALASNRHPSTGKPITPRMRKDRTVGWDLTFNAIKDFSILHGLTGDERLGEIFRRAVEDTMKELEKEAMARIRKDGQDGARIMSSMAWATFIHATSRPVDQKVDMHTHAHAFVFNVSHDPVEQQFKALFMREIVRDAPYWESAFHSRLSLGLADLGIAVERTAKGYRIPGIPDSVREKFSRRTAQIEKEIARLGITDKEEKAKMGAKTRSRKLPEQPAESLRKEWASRLTADEKEAIKGVLRLCPKERDPSAARESMAFALADSLERKSVIDRKRLLAVALKHGAGKVSVEDAHRELEQRGDVLRVVEEGREWVTTREALAEEKRLLTLAQEGRGACKPLADPSLLRAEGLNEGQEAAIRKVLCNLDRVAILKGSAGVGKTRSLKAGVLAMEAAGRKVFAFAPTSMASREVLANEGFPEATTTASLLSSAAVQDRLKPGDVLLVDEAGLVGNREMLGILELAKRKDARVLLVGDTSQHSSVMRGDSLLLLERLSGIRPARITKIVRQEDRAYREAVEALRDGRTTEGFRLLESIGAVKEVQREERYRLAASALADSLAQGRTALMVAPTHAEGNKAGALVREELRKRGLLSGEDKRFLRLRSLQLTEAARGDPASWEAGTVVQFGQNAPGFPRGSRATVVGKGEKGQVLVEDGKGRVSALPLGKAKHLEAYQALEQPFAVGDLVRITRNGTSADGRRLSNGAVRRIEGFTPKGDIVLEGGAVLGKDFGHACQGYLSTSVSAQGRTVTDVVILQGTPSLGAASSQEQFYVSASRGASTIRVFTDDKEALREAVGRSAARVAALDLFDREATGRQRVSRDGALQRRNTRQETEIPREGRAGREGRSGVGGKGGRGA